MPRRRAPAATSTDAGTESGRTCSSAPDRAGSRGSGRQAVDGRRRARRRAGRLARPRPPRASSASSHTGSPEACTSDRAAAARRTVPASQAARSAPGPPWTTVSADETTRTRSASTTGVDPTVVGDRDEVGSGGVVDDDATVEHPCPGGGRRRSSSFRPLRRRARRRRGASDVLVRDAEPLELVENGRERSRTADRPVRRAVGAREARRRR